MCLDIDRFKHVNEIYGTNRGDELLIRVSLTLKNMVREDDFVTRMEGNRFLILFSDIGDTDGIMEVVKKIKTIFSQPFRIQEMDITISVSMGIAIHPMDGSTDEELIRNSERALFMAKSRDNRYHFFDAKLNSELLENIKLEKELGEAIRHDQFIIHYQPKVKGTGSICGMEALVRWQSPERGLVYPGNFIPIAERTGMINPIGRMIFATVCRQIKALEYSFPKDFRVGINLSPVHFSQTDLIETISDIIKDSGINPSLIEVEITESGIMLDEEESIRKLQALNEMGIAISIDDFGTGYSSMSKLRDYPVDILKIDKSFIQRLPEDAKSVTIATAIIDMAHNLGFKVVAEGIEKEDQLDFLKESGCDFHQGYLFGRPMPLEELMKLLKQERESR
jgi:diguanylate cyclase (GGDEF)-like protein